MLILQIDTKGWGDLWERYGLAAIVLIGLSLAVWKLLWPLITKLVDSLNKDREDGRQAREQERKDFLSALKEITAEHRAAITKLAESVDGIRDEVRRSKG